MKRIFAFILSMLSVTAVCAQSQDNAIYVYRNDGSFNAFLREDIDSITVSFHDLDSVAHEDPVCQVFHTPDSIYRIPIAAIDSVSLVQPETRLQKDVMLLEARHLPYILSAEGNKIIFRRNTPPDLLPKKGSVIAATVFDAPLDNGFAGRVTASRNTGNGIEFDCDDVSLNDIYERLVYVGKMLSYDDKSEQQASKAPARVKGAGTASFPLGSYKMDLDDVELSVSPKLTVGYTVNVGMTRKPMVEMYTRADFDIKTEFSLGGIEKKFNKEVWLANIMLPTTVYGLYGSVKFGGFIKAKAEIGAKGEISTTASITTGFCYNDNGSKPYIRPSMSPIKPSLSMNLAGRLEVGACMRAGFNFVHEKVASLYVTGYKGFYAKGELSVSTSDYDGTLYTAMKDSKVEFGSITSCEPGGKVAGKSIEIPIKYESEKPLLTLYVFPEFSELVTGPVAQVPNTFSVTSTPSRNTLPVKLGFGVHDESGKLLVLQYCDDIYMFESLWKKDAMTKVFMGFIVADRHYKIYPYVKLLDMFDVRATPEKDVSFGLCPDENHPHIIDLGLKSGWKWSCCNLGAETPESFGDHYAWGETQPKRFFTEENYKHGHTEQRYNAELKHHYEVYVYTRLPTLSGTQYDAATVQWGEPWIMPTFKIFQELYEECTWEYVTYNGVRGQMVTGPNGNKIFLPAAGAGVGEDVSDPEFINYIKDVGVYWTATPDYSDPEDDGAAHFLGFYKNNVILGSEGGASRELGFSIRPIKQLQ